MNCVSCAATLLPTARFCFRCGTRQPARCANCARELIEGARFCAGCGTPATVPPPGSASAAPAVAPNPVPVAPAAVAAPPPPAPPAAPVPRARDPFSGRRSASRPPASRPARQRKPGSRRLATPLVAIAGVGALIAIALAFVLLSGGGPGGGADEERPDPVLAVNFRPRAEYELFAYVPKSSAEALRLPPGDWVLIRLDDDSLAYSPEQISLDAEEEISPHRANVPASDRDVPHAQQVAAFETLVRFVLLNHAHVLSAKAILAEDVTQPVDQLVSRPLSPADRVELRESMAALLAVRADVDKAGDLLVEAEPADDLATLAWREVRASFSNYLDSLESLRAALDRPNALASDVVVDWIEDGAGYYPLAHRGAVRDRFGEAPGLLVVARPASAQARSLGAEPAMYVRGASAQGWVAPAAFAAQAPVPFDIKVNDWGYSQDAASFMDGLTTRGELEPKDPEDMIRLIRAKIGPSGCVRTLLIMAHGSPGHVVGQVDHGNLKKWAADLRPLLCPETVADRGLRFNACNVAAGLSGQTFGQRLADELHIPVTAFRGSVIAGLGWGPGKTVFMPEVPPPPPDAPLTCDRWPDKPKPADEPANVVAKSVAPASVAASASVKAPASASVRASASAGASASAVVSPQVCRVDQAAIERELRAIIPSVPFWAQTDGGKSGQAPTTGGLRFGMRTNLPVTGVSEVGLEGQGIGLGWTVSTSFACRTLAEAKARFDREREPCGTKNVLPGALGEPSCVGSSSISGCGDCSQSGDPYWGEGKAFVVTACADISLWSNPTIAAPIAHGSRTKPEVVASMRAAAEKWVLETGKLVVTAVNKACNAPFR